MAYNPTEWINTLYDADGNVIQKGTPYSAENMNNIEQQLVELTDERGQPNGTATLNAEGIVRSSQLPSNLKEIHVVHTMADRDALDKFEGLRVMVMDASPDPTVESGWAEYVWDGVRFIKAAEKESLDIVLSWSSITDKPSEFKPVAHTHIEADITDLDKYTQAEVDAKLARKATAEHTHPEFARIVQNSERISTLETASGQLHTHANKAVLDKLAYSGSKPSIDLVQLDELATHTHSYASLTGKPVIPSQTSQLTNNSGYVTSNATKITVSATAPPSPKTNDIWIVI